MRRIFPLKSGNHGGQVGDYSSGKGSPRLKSRDPPEVIKRTGVKSKRSCEPSTSEDLGRSKREHWCPSCPAAPDNGVRCETPPSGDENVAKEEDKGVISPLREILRSSDGRQKREADLDLDEALKSVVAGAMRSAECRVVPVDKYSSSSSRRSGLGAVENLVHERQSKPPVKSKSLGPSRAISAPKVRPAQEAVATAEVTPRLHSMRILRVPDRVFDAQSPRIPRSPRTSSEVGSSNDSVVTPRSRLSYERKSSLNERKTTSSSSNNSLTPRSSHARSYSLTDGTGPSSSRKDRQPLTPTYSSTRKSLEASGSLRKEAPEASEKGSKYSGARIVAERLAKAFRGTSKASSVKEGKSVVEDGDELGAAENSIAHHRRRVMEQSEISYDASCSDNSTAQNEEKVSLISYLPHVRPVEAPQAPVRKEGSVLSWHEFVSEGRARLNDDGGVQQQEVGSGTSSGEAAAGGRRLPTLSSEKQMRSSSLHQDERDKEILKSWLEGMKRQNEGQNEDLESKAKQADERAAKLSGELSLLDDQLEFLQELQGKEENGRSTGISVMQQRIRKMHEDKKRLALEVAAEVKRRITERAAAKEVLVMMKREMEACVRVMEKEKLDLQNGFDRELERRENDWFAKFDKSRSEEKWLRERVRRLEEEKSGLQSELSGVGSKENSWRDKVKEFEMQMEGHKKRVEGAEKTILDLRESLANSLQQTRQAENEVEIVKKAYLETERESQKLSEQVERLQKLCKDQETSIHGLQLGLKNGLRNASDKKDGPSNLVRKELVRLSEIEKSLRSELESLRVEASNLRMDNRALSEKFEEQKRAGESYQDLQAEVGNLQMKTSELQDENNSLSFDLKQTLVERDRGREALKSLESSLSGIEKEKKALHEEMGREKNRNQEREKEILRLERRVEGLLKNNQMLQNILAMREKAAQVCDEEAKEKEKVVREAQQMELEMRESLHVSARQLCYLNQRVELMNDKLQERDTHLAAMKSECSKKDEVVRGLEESLGDLSKSLDAQHRRIMQLTTRNEELFRLYHAKRLEVEDLHAKMIEDTDNRRLSSQEMDQMEGRAKDFKQELEAQNMLCKLLKEKLIQREDDLKERSEEVAALVQSRDWLQMELSRVQSALADASHRLAGLERTLGQKEDLLSTLQSEKKEHVKELGKLRQELPRAERDRDQIQEEAEEIGREALRLSAEVEVLRRKVAHLEEDVMVKEGQISILRGSFGQSE